MCTSFWLRKKSFKWDDEVCNEILTIFCIVTLRDVSCCNLHLKFMVLFLPFCGKHLSFFSVVNWKAMKLTVYIDCEKKSKHDSWNWLLVMLHDMDVVVLWTCSFHCFNVENFPICPCSVNGNDPIIVCISSSTAYQLCMPILLMKKELHTHCLWND